ncbi:uncharacterized protein [Bos taurus]|uniref:uncharacterized protein n=1 Tax=Bos taurus TaxID=9913 RepID=UPI0028CB3AC2|nr:uncharacterized protein LOC132343977 [Bos taurus]
MVLGLLMEMRGNWLGSWCWLAMEAGRLAYQLENRQMPCPWRGSPNPSSLGDELGAVGRHEVAAIHRGSEGDCEGAGPQPPIWLVPFFHLALFVGHPCPLSSAGACSQGNGALEEGGWWFPLPRSGMQRVSEEQQAQTPALGREHTTSCPKLWVQRSGHCYLPLLQVRKLRCSNQSPTLHPRPFLVLSTVLPWGVACGGPGGCDFPGEGRPDVLPRRCSVFQDGGPALLWGHRVPPEPQPLSVCAQLLTRSVQLFVTPGLCNPRLLCPWDSPGKNTGVGCHSLLQRIFLTQGLNPGLPHCRQILYQLSHQ